MLLKSVLTSALLAFSLGSDIAAASKHGRFAEKARASQEKAKRAIEARNQKHERSEKDFRFLSKKTKRECLAGSLSISANKLTNISLFGGLSARCSLRRWRDVFRPSAYRHEQQLQIALFHFPAYYQRAG